MSEGVVIALITAIGSLIGGVVGQTITASSTIKAAKIEAKVETNQISKNNDRKGTSLKGFALGTLLGAVITLGILGFSGLLNTGNEVFPSFSPTSAVVATSTEELHQNPTMASSKFNILSFSEDFENGTQDFKIDGGSGSVRIVDDGTGNKVLELSDAGASSLFVTFGTENMESYVIAYRVKIVSLDNKQDVSGIANLILRYTKWGGPFYVFSFDPFYQNSSFYYYPPYEKIGEAPSRIVTGQWYDIRVEIDGENLGASIDGVQVIETTDSRLNSGGLGFQIYSNTTTYFDDVKIWIP